MENINLFQIEEFLKIYTAKNPYFFKNEMEREICIEHLSFHQYLLNTYLIGNTMLLKQKINKEIQQKCKTNELIDKLNLIQKEFKIYLDELICNQRYLEFRERFPLGERW